MKGLTKYGVCDNCRFKKAAKTTHCPLANKATCPDYQAAIAYKALQWEEAAVLIPVESLLTALRFHGYTGELRKSSTVII